MTEKICRVATTWSPGSSRTLKSRKFASIAPVVTKTFSAVAPAYVLAISEEVLVALFEADAKVLRTWDPSKGLSLRNFAGLLAEFASGATGSLLVMEGGLFTEGVPGGGFDLDIAHLVDFLQGHLGKVKMIERAEGVTQKAPDRSVEGANQALTALVLMQPVIEIGAE